MIGPNDTALSDAATRWIGAGIVVTVRDWLLLSCVDYQGLIPFVLAVQSRHDTHLIRRDGVEVAAVGHRRYIGTVGIAVAVELVDNVLLPCAIAHLVEPAYALAEEL